MKILSIDDAKSLVIAQEYLLAGKVIFYPTDTIYGFGCLADDDRGVKRLYELKQRPGRQPSLILINGLEMLSKYCQISDEQKKYLLSIWPGPITVICQGKSNLPSVSGESDSIAVRWADNDWLQALLDLVQRPLVSTSANISGSSPIHTVEELTQQFTENQPDLVIDAGQLTGTASKLIDLRFYPDIKTIRA